MALQFRFDNSYARLPERFGARLTPVPVAAPRLLALNAALAGALGLDPAALAAPGGVAVLAGNAVPEGAAPMAQAYAGHQFGGWVPQLGDGRAWFGPVLREYLVSEAMHALGIPTTRALAAVATGESVLRESGPLPGAVLARVASSHVRVGTFQYFAARRDDAALRLLADHVIARHYPQADGAMDLLHAVVAAQARLIAAWMSVGFVHGVMNTDNMSVAGETIDYGPCAFLDGYHPDTTFSAIDQWGRYAYARQPDIALWNLAQFASCLLPLMGGDAAVAPATEAVQRFPALFRAAWLSAFRAKLGLDTAQDGDAALIGDLLDLMAATRADFTATFRALGDTAPTDAAPTDATPFDAAPFDAAPLADWHARWAARLLAEGATPEVRRQAMRAANPAVVPRNHRVEAVIAAAVAGDMAPFDALLAAATRPFDDNADFAAPPEPWQAVTQTFCGT